MKGKRGKGERENGKGETGKGEGGRGRGNSKRKGEEENFFMDASNSGTSIFADFMCIHRTEKRPKGSI